MLVARGLDGLSLRALAGKIDYAPSAVYKYFKSKQDILLAIREEGFAMGAEMQAEGAPDTLPPPQRLLASGRAYLRFADLHPEHYLLMFDSPELGPAGVQELLHDPRFSGVPQMIRDGVERGCFRLPQGYTPEIMALQCWIMVHGMVMLKLGAMRDAGAEFRAVCDHLLVNLIAGITV